MENMEIGEFESFLLANKKQMISDFYQMNLAEIKEKTGAKSVGGVKSGILVLVSSLVAYISYNCQLSIPEVLKTILINASYITIGGVAIFNIIKSIELIVCHVISKRNAKQQFEFIYNMAHTFKADFDNGRIPNFVAVLSDSSGIITEIVLSGGIVKEENGITRKSEFINLHFPNGDVVVLEKDDFVSRFISLDEHIMYNPYNGSEEDAIELQELIRDYAKVQGKNGAEEYNRLSTLLYSLEHRVMMKTGFGNNFSNDGITRVLRKEENE